MIETTEHVYEDPEVDEYYREMNQSPPEIDGLQGIAMILTMFGVYALIIMNSLILLLGRL